MVRKFDSLTDTSHWAYDWSMTYYPNADEVRDDISETELSDEELESYWCDADPSIGRGSGYYMLRDGNGDLQSHRWDVV